MKKYVAYTPDEGASDFDSITELGLFLKKNEGIEYTCFYGNLESIEDIAFTKKETEQEWIENELKNEK